MNYQSDRHGSSLEGMGSQFEETLLLVDVERQKHAKESDYCVIAFNSSSQTFPITASVFTDA